MERDVAKFWEIKRGDARVDIYAFRGALTFYVVPKENVSNKKLALEFQTAEDENRQEISKYCDKRGVVGNEYPFARAVVEYLMENNLIAVDEAEYVGPEYDDTIPARCDELIY